MIRAWGTGTLLIVTSVVTFFASIVLAWLFIVRIPADYLTNDDSKVKRFRATYPLAGAVLSVGKNLLGLLFAASGFIMLFIPGQGLLFIFLGLTLIDFPGRKELIRKLLSWRDTLSVINQIRSRAGRFPLEAPPHEEQPPNG